MELPRIEVQPKHLASLLAVMESGELQIPRFQRDFVWSLPKTRALFDSIFKEFPIGTFFLWRAPLGAPQLSRPLGDLGIPGPPVGSKVSYILDGQQRLTSLYVAMKGLSFGGRDYGRICLDLDAGTRFLGNQEEAFEEPIFVYRVPDRKRFVSLADVTGPEHLLVFEGLTQECRPAFSRLSRLLSTYPFSVVYIQEQGLGDAVEIFQRINQGGKRLSRYDLVCANVWTDDFDFRTKIEEVNSEFEQRGFGALDETIYTQAFSLALSGKCTTTAELSLTTQEVQAAWKKVIKCISRAVDFASANLGVRRSEYLPYRGIIPVLAAVFYSLEKANPTQAQRDLLWTWFWKVALSERYGSTSPSRMAEDLRLLREGLGGPDAVEFPYPSKVTPDVILKTKMTSTASAIRNAAICMLALRGPRNFKNGSPIDLAEGFFSDLNRPERHHIFPVAYLKTVSRVGPETNLLSNFCFIPADLNKEIGARKPSEYLGEYSEQNTNFEAAARSHLIPVEQSSPVWSNTYDEFLSARAAIIADALNGSVEAGPPSLSAGARDDHGSLRFTDHQARVDSAERALRLMIDTLLTGVAGEAYWKALVPTDINGHVKERVKEHVSRHPYDHRPQSALEKLSYCDISDYEKIFMANWTHFGHLFGRKDELQRHMVAYRHLRNAVQHNREPTPVERQAGEAALLWLEGVLGQYEISRGTDESEDEANAG